MAQPQSVEQLKAKLYNIQKSIETGENALAETEAANDEKKRRKELMRKEIALCQSEIVRMKDAKIAWSRDADSAKRLVAEVERIKDSLQEIAMEKASLLENLAVMAGEIEGMQEDQQHEMDDKQDIIVRVNTAEMRWKEQYDQSRIEFSEMEKKVTDLEDMCTTLSQEEGDLVSAIKTFETQLEEWNTNISTQANFLKDVYYQYKSLSESTDVRVNICHHHHIQLLRKQAKALDAKA